MTAPGESVWRGRTEDGTFEVVPGSGTSYAVATVAGACALWLAFHGRQRLIRAYGPRHLAAVFKEVLTTHGVDTPPEWDGERHGAGILNAKKLLQAALPPTPVARGMRSPRLRPDSSVGADLDRIARHFPDLDRAKLRTALRELLGSRGPALDRDLLEFGDELSYHVAINPRVRTALTRRAVAKALTRAIVRRPFRADPSLLRDASRALRQRVLADR